MVVSDNVQIGY